MIMRTVCLKYGGWHYYRYIYLSEPALTHSSIPKSNVRSLWQSNIIFAFRSYICNVLLFPSTSNVDLRCAQCAHCNTLYFLRESCTNRRKVIWHPTIPLVSAFMRGRVGWGRDKSTCVITDVPNASLFSVCSLWDVNIESSPFFRILA